MPSSRNLSEKSVTLLFVLVGIVATASLTLLLFQAGYSFSSNVTGIDRKIQATPTASSENQSSPLSLSSNNATTVGSKTLTIKLLADNLENRLNKSAAILETTSKLPEVRKVSFASSINNTLRGIPKDIDLAKRNVAQGILSKYNDFRVVALLLPNGNMYMEEPYSRQLNLTKTNFAFRDYYKGAISTHNTFLGNLIIASCCGLPQANMAVPIYSSEYNNTNNQSLVGVWYGGLDLDVFNKSLQSLNLTDNERIVYVDQHGQKIADSDKKQSIIKNQTFANFQGFKNAIAGKSGSIIEGINGTKILVFYHPVNAIQARWAILDIQPLVEK
ncbi:MAG TPA: cache domain-containing protein [Nitrososphaeraceae archaeon]